MENSPSSPYALGRYLEDTQRVPLLTSDDETRLSQLIFAGREAASIPEEQQDETTRQTTATGIEAESQFVQANFGSSSRSHTATP